MKISCIKFKEDEKSFNILKGFGTKVIELEDPELTDNIISGLIEQKYDTIFLSNEVAGFSEDLVKKYKSNENVNIVISKSKRE